MDPAPKLDPMIEMALRSLHDVAMPPPVSWMPNTWGWAGLAVIILVLLLAVATKAIRRFRSNAYRREALQRLANLEQEMTDAARRSRALRELAELLKRTALAAWPRARVAPLTSTGWTQFLDGSGGCGKDLARLLSDLEYRGNASLSSLPENYVEDAFRAARQWIEKHHVSA
jgi:type II secretory pathway pseudopilin PulG